MSRVVSFLVLVGVIVVIGILFYRVMASFLLPLFVASVLVVMFRPLHQWFLDRYHGRRRIAAFLTTVTITIVVMVPALTLVTLAAIEASGLVIQINDTNVPEKLSSLRSSLGMELPCAQELRYVQSSMDYLMRNAMNGTAAGDDESLENLLGALAELKQNILEKGHGDTVDELAAMQTSIRNAMEETTGSFHYQTLIQQADHEYRVFRMELSGGGYRAWLMNLANPSEEKLRDFGGRLATMAPSWLQSVGGATGGFVVDLVLGLIIMIVGVYFFLADGPAMVRTLMRLSPLDDRHEQELLREFDRISRAVVVATLLSAAVQGLLAGLGYWLAGAQPVFVLMLLTAVLALIPFVGAAAVWLPVSLWLFLVEGHYVSSILLAVYGAAVVSSADNVIKPLVLHGQSRLHPLLALLSVLGGVQALGPIGILVGPMVVVFLQTLLNILHRELTSLEPRHTDKRPRRPLPAILSLRLRGLRLTYAPPRMDSRQFLKERAR